MGNASSLGAEEEDIENSAGAGQDDTGESDRKEGWFKKFNCLPGRSSSAIPADRHQRQTHQEKELVTITTFINDAISDREGDDEKNQTSATRSKSDLRYRKLHEFLIAEGTNLKADEKMKLFELLYKMKEAKVQDYIVIEDRIRKDYDMYRDIIREENGVINARQGTFRTLTGFLFAAIGLGLGRLDGNKDKSIALLRFMMMVSIVGLGVSVISILTIRRAYIAMGKAGRQWKACRDSYAESLTKNQNGKKIEAEYIGPQLMGGMTEKGEPEPGCGLGWEMCSPLLFLVMWSVMTGFVGYYLIQVNNGAISFGEYVAEYPQVNGTGEMPSMAPSTSMVPHPMGPTTNYHCRRGVGNRCNAEE